MAGLANPSYSQPESFPVEQQILTNLKIIFLGDILVGKTALLHRYVKGSYNPNITSTVGGDTLQKGIYVGGKKVLLTLQDTSGQERFRSIIPTYYRGSQVRYFR